MRILLFLGVVTWLAASSKATSVGPAEAPLIAVESSVTTFSHKFVQAVAENATGNLVSSPLSAYMVLTMLSFGASGKTEEELRSGLGLPKGDFTERGIRSFVYGFDKFTKVALRLANNIFLDKTIKPKTAFTNVTKTVLRAEAQSVDFRKPAEARETINQWCEKKTDNHIKNLLSTGDISPSTLLVLVNAVYFKGGWSSVFDPKATDERPFYLNNGTIKNVTTMHDTRYLPYGELPEVDAKFIALRFESAGEDDAISMLIVLPNKRNGLVDLTKNLGKVNITDLFGRSEEKVDIHLPRFRIESSIDLNEPLIKLGLGGVFENTANFSGIVDGPGIGVSKAIQKAFIEVNEAGTTAAAATYVALAGSAPGPVQPPIDFHVDRPFLSVIATRSGRSLFVSVVNDPTL